MDVREQITALREQLRYHNEKYYNEDAPEITDYEYDMLQRQLRALEAEHPEMADANSPTQRVGGTASSRFAKVTHAIPLESLQDVFSFDELGRVLFPCGECRRTGGVRCRVQDRRPFGRARICGRRVRPRWRRAVTVRWART